MTGVPMIPDGDGIKNGEEAIVSLRTDGLVYIYFVSDPCTKDSDFR